MTISNDDSTAATAAITALNSALATYATKGDPTQKDLYARDVLLPLIASSITLAATLGQELLTELIANATTAVTPYVSNTVELNRVIGELGVLRALRGQVKGLSDASRIPSEAVNPARLIISIFTQVLAAV